MLARTMIALAVVCTGTAAKAQTSYWRKVAYSHLLPQDQIVSLSVAGNFTGHDVHDIALLMGGRVALCAAPAIHNSITPVTDLTNATGLATLGRGPNGRESLAIATTSGLFQWAVDATSLVTIEGGVDWRSVASADLDGVPPLDLAGKCGNDTLRVLLRAGTSTTALQHTFTGETIAHVLPVRWNATGPYELAVATNQRLWIGSQTTMLTQTFAVNDDCQITRVRMGDHDDVVWWRSFSNQRTLHVFSSLGASQSGANSLGAVRYLTSGDRFGSEHDDLLVSFYDSLPMRVVINGAAVASNIASFDLASGADETPYEGTTPPDGQNYGAAWTGDLNSDGGIDTVAPLMLTFPSSPSVSFLWVRINMAVGLQRPKVDDPSISDSGNQRTFSLPVSLFMGQSIPVGADYLELLPFAVRMRSGSLAIMPDGLPRVRVAQSASSIAFTVTVDATIPPAFAGVVRWIDVDANGITVKVWPSTRVIFAMDSAVPGFVAWRDGRAAAHPPGNFQWLSTFTPATSVYLLRPITPNVPNGGIYTTYGGDEEPPDLPPPPPVPPRPPTPPPGP
jgi:hypothetical protein